MLEIRELEPVGTYDLSVFHVPNETTVHCSSESSPIKMAFWYRKIAAQNGSYALTWPTNLPRDEAAEIIRGVGAGEPDSKYECIVDPHDEPPVTAMLLNEDLFEEMRAHIGEEDLPEIRGGSTVDEALMPGFDELSVTSSGLYFSWDSNEGLGPEGPEFHLAPLNNTEVTDPYIFDLVKRTIAAEHIGGVAVSLENLGAIFEQYRHISPASLLQ